MIFFISYRFKPMPELDLDTVVEEKSEFDAEVSFSDLLPQQDRNLLTVEDHPASFKSFRFGYGATGQPISNPLISNTSSAISSSGTSFSSNSSTSTQLKTTSVTSATPIPKSPIHKNLDLVAEEHETSGGQKNQSPKKQEFINGSVKITIEEYISVDDSSELAVKKKSIENDDIETISIEKEEINKHIGDDGVDEDFECVEKSNSINGADNTCLDLDCDLASSTDLLLEDQSLRFDKQDDIEFIDEVKDQEIIINYGVPTDQRTIERTDSVRSETDRFVLNTITEKIDVCEADTASKCPEASSSTLCMSESTSHTSMSSYLSKTKLTSSKTKFFFCEELVEHI